MRRLVTLNQNELITVHSIMQGVHVNELDWLCVEQQQRVTASESVKRREMATQFMHWLFDSYLIPLLQVSVDERPCQLNGQATFYATETQSTGYGTVYFHHAAWVSASRPHLDKLAATVLEELDPVRVAHCPAHTTERGREGTQQPTGRRFGALHPQVKRALTTDYQPWQACCTSWRGHG